MTKDQKNQEDYEAFKKAMEDVKPLSHNKITPVRKVLPRKKNEIMEHDLPTNFFTDDNSIQTVSQETIISFKKTAVSDKLLRKLKKGQYNVEFIFDLHGLRVSEVEKKLGYFLLNCDYQVVLLIHGKGKDRTAPILKNKLNQWLRHHSRVLAFCTALPRDGGNGALYVLLKNLHKGKVR